MVRSRLGNEDAGEATSAPRTARKKAAQELSPEDKQKALKAAYVAATSELRRTFQSEFNALYQAAAAERGVDWSPKPTAEQKASQEFDALLEQYPFLRDRLANPEGAALVNSAEDEDAADGEESA